MRPGDVTGVEVLETWRPTAGKPAKYLGDIPVTVLFIEGDDAFVRREYHGDIDRFTVDLASLSAP